MPLKVPNCLLALCNACFMHSFVYNESVRYVVESLQTSSVARHMEEMSWSMNSFVSSGTPIKERCMLVLMPVSHLLVPIFHEVMLIYHLLMPIFGLFLICSCPSLV